jgi:hypothetical protein
MVQITGVLKDPLGNPLSNTVIRITSVNNQDTLWGISGSITTDLAGNYNFTLQEDNLLVEILRQDGRQFLRAGTVDTTGATGPLTLEELFETYADCEYPLPVCDRMEMP